MGLGEGRDHNFGLLDGSRMINGERVVLGALVAGAFLLYHATRLQVHNQGGDFTNYAAAIQRNGLSDKWFYGDHLAYVFLLNWIYHSLRTVTADLDAMRTAQVFNSI